MPERTATFKAVFSSPRIVLGGFRAQRITVSLAIYIPHIINERETEIAVYVFQPGGRCYCHGHGFHVLRPMGNPAGFLYVIKGFEPVGKERVAGRRRQGRIAVGHGFPLVLQHRAEFRHIPLLCRLRLSQGGGVLPFRISVGFRQKVQVEVFIASLSPDIAVKVYRPPAVAQFLEPHLDRQLPCRPLLFLSHCRLLFHRSVFMLAKVIGFSETRNKNG